MADCTSHLKGEDLVLWKIRDVNTQAVVLVSLCTSLCGHQPLHMGCVQIRGGSVSRVASVPDWDQA